MSSRFILLLVSVALSVVLAGPPRIAEAQQAPAPQVSAQVVRAQTASAPNPVYAWIAAKQGEYNKRLADLIREIRTGDPLVAGLLLSILSFVYGVLHAAGPGHGKAIISSYVLANERTVRRGIALSFLAAFFQALSAILLVGILVVAFKATGLTIKATENWLETISWGLVAMLGGWMVWRQLTRMGWLGGSTGSGHAHHHHAHAHAHHHDHAHDHQRHGATGHAHASHAHHAHSHGGGHQHGHSHGDHGDHSECCGHAHMPDPRQLEAGWSWSRALPLALAVGIRPCTGAIFVLGFAIAQGLLWAGVLATFAMALGTAITVSALAVIAVTSRELAARLGGEGSVMSQRIQSAAALGGSLAVLVLGVMLCLGSLSANGVI